MEGAGEAVERDALDGCAECCVGHAATAFMVLDVVLFDVERLGVGDDDVRDVEREVDAHLVLGIRIELKLAGEDGGVGREPPLAGLVDQLVEAELAVVHAPAQRLGRRLDAVDAELRAGDARARQGAVPGQPDLDGGAGTVGRERALLDDAIGDHDCRAP